jgi:hypothetical protein
MSKQVNITLILRAEDAEPILRQATDRVVRRWRELPAITGNCRQGDRDE